MTAFEIFRGIKLLRFCRKFAKTQKFLPRKFLPRKFLPLKYKLSKDIVRTYLPYFIESFTT